MDIIESIVLAGTPGQNREESSILSEQSVFGNIFFMMMAGHETVGNALAFALYCHDPGRDRATHRGLSTERQPCQGHMTCKALCDLLRSGAQSTEHHRALQ